MVGTAPAGAGDVTGLIVHDVVEPTDEAHATEVDDEKGAAVNSNHVADDENYPAPTEEEDKTLRKVADSVPWTAWLLCLVELAERTSYYGTNAVFGNFIQFPLPQGGNGSGAIDPQEPESTAGALGLGGQAASGVVLAYTFIAYVIPIFGAWWADTKIGRFRAMVYGTIIGGIAHVILIGGAAPALLKAGKGAAPFFVGLVLLALGAGIFKPNVAPTFVDQYTHQRKYTKILKSGEKVIVDPETTISYMLLIYYACINLGAFIQLGSVYIEKYRGYWLAFLVPGIIYFLLPPLLAVLYKRTVRKPPQGSDLTNFVKITMSAIKKSKGRVFSRSLWHNVKPSTLAERGEAVTYSEKDVSDCQRTWEAVTIFAYIPVWYLNDGGVGSVSSYQAAAMTTYGAPNDLLSTFNPIVIVVFSIFMAQVGYPVLRYFGITLGRIDRMICGFILATLSGLVGAIVQWRVYATSACGYQATFCEAGPSPISIWWQLPNVALGGMSEIFVFVTSYELAYARAPQHMKATVIALFLFMTALSGALGEIILPAIGDPTLIWAWAAPAIALFVQTIIFVWRHRGVNDDAFITHEEDFELSIGAKKLEDNTEESKRFES
ncbi:POT family protein [Xylariaceae sp. FL1272]|nr:POT family protein [Xylariaceae sp. FL1272]